MRAHTALFLATALACSCADNGKEESTANATPPASKTTESPEAATEHSTKPVAKVRIETIQFPAEDGLLVTADLYQWHDEDAPFIVLFHQAGWSRGEYKEIAPKLGELGYNCLAVDQRSGKGVNKVDNETFKLAKSKKMPTGFVDALADMRAALRLVESRYPDAKRIAWGSSYSSALVLVLAGEEPELMDAVLSFSPGEYFARFGKSKSYVKEAAAKMKAPVFITSAKDEHKSWKAIFEAIEVEQKTSFLPTTKGNHGSRALWAKHKDAEAYWTAVEQFLGGL
jgi:dienelactone hydrolase